MIEWLLTAWANSRHLQNVVVKLRIENPRVCGSIPPLGTISQKVRSRHICFKIRSPKNFLSY